MTLYRCRGVVLRTVKLGEADRIVSFVTDTHGKVRAVAKGIRKTKSRLGARLEPTSHVSLLLYQGRELDIVSQAETIDHFPKVRDDLERLTHATALLEAIDHLCVERRTDERLYQMLVGGLRELNRADSAVLVGAFYWKLLAYEGYEPVIDACVHCGSEGPLVGFDPAAGGATCRACSRGPAITSGTLELLGRVLNGGLAAALREPPGAATHEMERLATLALEHVLDRRLRAARIFDRW